MLPSSTESTASWRPAASGSSTSAYLRTALTGRMTMRCTLPRRVMRASAIPNPRYSAWGPAASGRNGRMAIERLEALTTAGFAFIHDQRNETIPTRPRTKTVANAIRINEDLEPADIDGTPDAVGDCADCGADGRAAPGVAAGPTNEPSGAAGDVTSRSPWFMEPVPLALGSNSPASLHSSTSAWKR